MGEARILRESCAHVRFELAHDMPAAAFLARPAIFNGVLSLLRTTELAELRCARESKRGTAQPCTAAYPRPRP
jgi:hypothetical protein